ncbi:hypothetical protein BDFB_010678 [Asbolus verrucosus]|uniref:Uncharacterized protein n=1 Tax=Asbolus verrucosus TaxID=1661398 RepID=A0A482VK37_ASBVE|nr:hypothetical protein BDFB_010678 [Asbolus verrucosus]
MEEHLVHPSPASAHRQVQSQTVERHDSRPRSRRGMNCSD